MERASGGGASSEMASMEGVASATASATVSMGATMGGGQGVSGGAGVAAERADRLRIKVYRSLASWLTLGGARMLHAALGANTRAQALCFHTPFLLLVCSPQLIIFLCFPSAN